MRVLEDDIVERITQKTDSGYEAQSIEAAIEKLGRLEDMYDDLKREYDLAVVKMESTPDSKKGSASYRQVFSNKLTLGLILSKFDIYLE